ncbi:leucine-rich repeat family protein [Reticulomyxa filosa]|uniref:Leucine-rich repeat family protein n=1 Tax=Reticulomyxa filosa TaxID=46433 RepID=X6M9V5_RETFI|nr:leucine-rich repeat family protein [Reticulomyxa filosa]|eukprot:ETO10262.1 leucine-rich repeat family protein [Reticulomyxa filosa]
MTHNNMSFLLFRLLRLRRTETNKKASFFKKKLKSNFVNATLNVYLCFQIRMINKKFARNSVVNNKKELKKFFWLISICFWLNHFCSFLPFFFSLLYLNLKLKKKTTKVSQTSNLSESEMNALLCLYNATNGLGWNISSNDGCSFKGIVCDYENGQLVVTEIILNNQNLVGTIPECVGNFSHLQQLIFTENFLDGSIPPEIWKKCVKNYSQLSRLRLLALDNNRFSLFPLLFEKFITF